MKATNQSEFTLLELLIVVAVIIILLTLLMPSIRSAKLSAMTGVSMSNLNQIYKGGYDLYITEWRLDVFGFK